MKNLFLIKWYVFNRIRPYLGCGEPEGRKPSALYQNPGSMHFTVSLTFDKKGFLLNYYILIELEVISVVADPEGGNQALSIRIRCRHYFCVFPTCYKPHLLS